MSCCLKQRLNLHSDRNFNCNILINVTADCYILLSNRLTVCNCTVNVINSFNVNNHYSDHYRDCSLRNNLACCFICKYNFVTGRINVRDFLNSYLCTLKRCNNFCIQKVHILALDTDNCLICTHCINKYIKCINKCLKVMFQNVMVNHHQWFTFCRIHYNLFYFV